MSTVYNVCIPHTLRDFFDYQAVQGCEPCIGARVWVPFRKQNKLGIIVGKTEQSVINTPLKLIESVLDDSALLTEPILTLCTWIASYYQSPLSEVIALAIPKKYRLGQSCELPKKDFYRLIIPAEEALTKVSARASKQQALIHLLEEQKTPQAKATIAAQGYSLSQLLSLTNLGIIELIQQQDLPEYNPNPLKPALNLNEEQQAAVDCISSQLNQFQCFLLQGITGSGKTEVYLQVIQKVLALDQQILVLVPEIGLTPQLIERFTERFNQPVTAIHSSLNETERQIAWQLAKENKVQIIIGTRTALFTPLPNLGLIIIDEEHDSSLKQMEGVRYSARDSALMRAHLFNIPIILGSATPSLESLYNCQQKKYTLLRLNSKALTSTALHYQMLDLRSQTLKHGLTQSALNNIKKHLDAGNQVLVFINRRGFAPILLCHQCGWMKDCTACDSHLTLHKQSGQMVCHHCGLVQAPPRTCSSCKSTELIPVGAGTQRIHEYLSDYFPKFKVVRIDKDETRKKNSFAQHLEKISSGEVQLIVGTQMLAKGHHFPRLSLVVILDADAGLYNQDFRATEQLGQLLIQVAGRAGRAEHPGEVLIQTHLPHHPLLNLLIQEGYDAFAQSLLHTRQQAQLPPFQYLAVLRAQGKSQNTVFKLLQTAKEHLQANPLTLLGPAPAPLARKANQYRMQLLIKSPSRALLKSALTRMREWLTMDKVSNNIRWNVDVDPMDLS